LNGMLVILRISLCFFELVYVSVFVDFGSQLVKFAPCFA